MRKLYENFHILYFQKRIVSAETIQGNTVVSAETIRGNTVHRFLIMKYDFLLQYDIYGLQNYLSYLPTFLKIEPVAYHPNG